MGKGWFKIAGRDGERTLAEQMTGIGAAIAEASGKTILDLGAAEGLIALEFAKAGASAVRAIEFNADLVQVAETILAKAGPLPIEIERADMVDVIANPTRPQYDIVLALAILHKLPDPEAGVRYCAESARSLLVVRLPIGSTGRIRSKYAHHMSVEMRDILPGMGFKLERKADGPRGEQVRYWRRQA